MRETNVGPILVVEDNHDNRAFLVTAVTKLGYSAMGVETAGAALAALGLAPVPGVEAGTSGREGHAAVAILLDVGLPDLDGRELTRHIRAQGRPDLPIIAITAMAMSGDRESCLTAGMNDYLAKPLTIEMIREVLERWVGPAG